MRAPDQEATLHRDAPALGWTKAGDLVAQMVETMGIPREQAIQLKESAPQPLSDDAELRVRCWKMRKVVQRPDQEAGVATWLINGPFHPFWRWWVLGVVHLRPLADVPPATVKREGASHEVLIFSVDPEKMPEPDIDAIERGETDGLPHLVPFDLVHQVVGLSDEQAGELAELMIRAMLTGDLSPDSDFRGRWEATLDETAEHLRHGGHP